MITWSRQDNVLESSDDIMVNQTRYWNCDDIMVNQTQMLLKIIY